MAEPGVPTAVKPSLTPSTRASAAWIPLWSSVSSLVQGLLALLFFAVMAGSEALDAAVVRLIVASVVLTGVVVVTFGRRVARLGPNRTAYRLGWARATTSWLFAPAAATWLAPPTPSGWPSDILTAAVISIGLSGVVIGQLNRRVHPRLWTRALRGKGGGAPYRDIPGRSLAANLGALLAGLVGISVVLSVGIVLMRGPGGIAELDLGDPSLSIVLTSFAAALLIAGFAGASVGRSPGRDVRSIARRLDALGYDSTQAMDWPVAVTSFDDLGRLFQELEALRRRLASEVRRYQDALDRTRDADTAKANFLAAVSHELRTPLNSIEGYAQLLLEGTPEPMTEAQREDVRLIRAGARQLLALINDILDISMIESGELSLSFGEHDIGALVREVVDIHRPLVRVDDKALLADCPQDLPLVICDRRRVSQVLNNLVSNAIKFTEVGSITVRATHDRAENVFTVRVIDTGVGIAPDELETIFDEFRQVGELKRRVKGTGLGLAIARSIARAHGGDLRASSEAGVGSTFTLTLPLRPDSTPEKIDVTEARVRAAALAQKRSGQMRRYVGDAIGAAASVPNENEISGDTFGPLPSMAVPDSDTGKESPGGKS